LRAKWLSIESSNRITAPDVVEGETVLLFKYDKIDEYYWITIFREPTLRRLEEVVYAYSNLKDGLTKFDRNSSYWIEYNTKKKFIHLHTSDNDNEASRYDIKINTKYGIVTIIDKQKNEIRLNSPTGELDVNINNKVQVKSGTIVLSAPSIVLDGDVSITKSLNCSGDVQSGGSVIDANGNTNHHSHP